MKNLKASYDKLILSPGAGANSLGFDSDYIFTLRNMEDTDAIDQFIDHIKLKSISSRSRLYFIRSLGEFIC